MRKTPPSSDEEYVESVLSVVDRIGPGRVATYGAVAAAVGRDGPRQVGRVMRLHGDSVSWWRVVHADGTPPTCHGGIAEDLLRSEGTPFSTSGRIDMATAAMTGGTYCTATEAAWKKSDDIG